MTEQTPEPTNEPAADPVPDPEPIAWEPQTYYAVTVVCRTPDCPEENIVKPVSPVYSNNGDPKYVRVVCSGNGRCNNDCTILTATKLDPQPPEG